MKKKLKKFLIILLIVAVIAVVLAFVIKKNLEPTVNDYTVQGETITTNQDDTKETEDSEEIKENSAALSPLVKVIGEESANNVNAGIVSLKTNSDSTIDITIDSVGKDEFSSYEKGDIFILDGNEETPFGEVYIGKIVSKDTDSSGNLIVKSETPALDEVFDEIHIDETTLLTETNVKNIATVDGVSVRFVDDLDNEMENVSNTENDYKVTYLDNNWEYDIPELEKVSTIGEASSEFLIELNCGLEYDFLTGKLTTKSTADITDTVNAELLNGLKDYSKDNSENFSSDKTLNEGEEAKDTGSADIESKVEFAFTGKIGMEDLTSTLDFDFNIFKGGVQDLSWTFGGKAVADVDLSGKYSGEISGEKTEASFGDSNSYSVKCEGLSKKTFPIAYIDFSGTTLEFDQVYSGITFIPVACGVMIYSDIEGNISLTVGANFDYANTFNYKITVFEDGKLCSDMMSFTSEQTGKAELNFLAEMYTDVTVLGFSGLITISNVNVLELGLVDLGLEAEARLDMNLTTNLVKNEETDSYEWVTDEPTVDFDGYFRTYFKAAELKVRLKLKTTGFDDDSIFNIDKDWSHNITFIDLTIYEAGTKTSTTYDKGLMEYDLVTAKDELYEYYKEYSEKTSSSKLIRRDSSNVTEELAIEDDFIGICGIDRGYVYVFKLGSSGGYDVYRVAKDGTQERNKVIISGTSNILLEDEENFYYLDKDKTNEIKSINRDSLEIKTLQEFDDGMEPFMMQPVGNYFYVAAKDNNDTLSWLFGGSNCKYYYVSDFNTDPINAEDIFTSNYGSYSISYTMVDKNLLRGTVSTYNLNPGSGGESIPLETDVCYNHLDDGVFVVDEEDGKYNMYLYEASSGTKTFITETKNENATYTLVKGSDGNYYFLDQENGKTSLCKINISTLEKTTIKEFDNFNIDLLKCGVSTLGTTVFFYEMPDDYTLNVKYRYTVY